MHPMAESWLEKANDKHDSAKSLAIFYNLIQPAHEFIT